MCVSATNYVSYYLKHTTVSNSNLLFSIKMSAYQAVLWLMGITGRTFTTLAACEPAENTVFSSSRLSPFIVIYYFYLLVSLLRTQLCTVAKFYPDQLLPYLQLYYFAYDPSGEIFYFWPILDKYFLLCTCLVFLLMFYFDYLITFTRGFQSYRQVFDLTVINRQDFYQLNPLIGESWKNLLVFFRHSKGFDSRRVQLRCQTLPHWGPIEHSIRVKAVVQSTYYDLVIAFTVVFLAAFSPPIFACTSSLAPAWGRQSPLRQMIIFTDISLALYCLGRIATTSQVLSFALNLLINVQSAQQRTYNCQLAKMIALMKRRAVSGQEKSALADSPAKTTAAKSNKPQSIQDRNGRGRLHPSLATHLLTAFLRAHLQLVKATLTFDKEVISQTLFFAFAALFPFNLYAVSLLSLTTMATSAQLILFCICSFHFFCMVLVGRPTITLQKVLYSPASSLYVSTMLVGNGGSELQLKLKLAKHYEVLTTGEKIAFNVGPLGKITTSSFFEVIFFIKF